MAITFTQEKKRQKYLILIALGIFIIVGIIWGWGFLKEVVAPPAPPVVPPEMVPPDEMIPHPHPHPPRIEINWQILKDPKLEKLEIFEIPPFEEEIGRENPFIPPKLEELLEIFEEIPPFEEEIGQENPFIPY